MATAAGTVLRLDSASRRQATRFDLDLDADARARMARELGLRGLGRLRLTGRLLPEGQDDWRLEARLAAQAVQDCVVTLAPVPARIDEEISRRYLAHVTPPPPGESEMPDEEIEPAPRALDLLELAREALALALPPWPRAPGAGGDDEPGEWQALPPGATAGDAPRRPFAALESLRGKPPAGDGAAAPAPRKPHEKKP